MFKVDNKTPRRRYWRRSGVFIANFLHISHLFYCFHCRLWTGKFCWWETSYNVALHLFKVVHENTRAKSIEVINNRTTYNSANIYAAYTKSMIEILKKRGEICSKLTIKTLEQRHWRRSGVFIVNFENISHLFLKFLLLKCYWMNRWMKFR